MTQQTAKKQGTPNWADCATTDLDACEAFYAAVFGWTAERATGSNGEPYSIQRLNGQMVAGLYELNEDMRRMNVPPHWGTYIEVDDVAATVQRVRDAGGIVVGGPFDEPGVGTIAIIQDSVGAFLRLWHSAPDHGGEVFNVPGAMTWNELNTKEPDKAAAFYETVLGVEVEKMDTTPPYTAFKVDGRAVAGILTMTPEMGEFPPSWDVYFASDDIDATTKAALDAGGSVVRAPFDIPSVGARMAVLRDPQGAVFEVIKMEAAG